MENRSRVDHTTAARVLFLIATTALAGAGCGGSTGTSTGTGGAPGAGGAHSGTGGAAGASAAGGRTGGTGGHAGVGATGGASGTTITGSVNGMPFSAAMTALWIGMPDPNTPPVTVVYLFEKPVSCSALTNAGWDATLGAANQDIEMKAAGAAPGVYTVVGGNPAALAAGEAVVNHSLLTANPTEQVASAGSTITLSALNTNRDATGSFHLTFPNGTLEGTFDAAWCLTGREP